MATSGDKLDMDFGKGMQMGQRIAQRLVAALSGNGIPYDRLVEIVYGECRAIESEQIIGDWLELPTGTTYTLTFKPTKGD